ncbi:virulence protein E [Comamonas aquatica]|uniref:VapE domain-containing protein n=1 Tax=Comamonas aquatica TaxID=225991 RepID=UPI0022DE34AB|nr:VapE domain-containing protein [Comamonas aquatica]WBM43105.1 virulence protein E [Comamonas aquatica]
MTHHRQELPSIQYKALADALLPMADTLVPQWLSGGQRIGHEWKCGSLAGEAGGSTSINLVTGAWADFATGEQGGDLLGLYAAIHSLTMAQAAVQLARELHLEDVAGLVKTATGANVKPLANPRPAPAPRAATTDKEKWHALQPVPVHAPAAPFKHTVRAAEDILHTAAYWVDGELYGYVVRYRTSDGGKETIPYTYCQSERDGGQKWHYKTWDEPRPLFFPGGKKPGERTVILVEGEVKAEVLQGLLDAHAPGVYCVVSWPGGSNAWNKAQWSWLAGCTVLQWPDCDALREKLTRQEQLSVADDPEAKAALQASKPILPEAKQPSTKAMQGIGLLLRDTHGCTVSRLPIPAPGEKPSGWDCKDAIADEGWTFDDVLAFFGKAQPLPSVDAAEPAAEADAPEKNSRSPVGTKGRGSAGGGDGGDDTPAGKDETPPPKGTPWWLKPYWDKQKARWNISRKTVIAALEHDEALQGVVAFNELTNSIQCRKAWPWPHARPGEIKGADGLLLGKYLTDTYSLPSVSKAALEEAVQTVAYTERFHPIRERLIDLKWDGKARIDNWLIFVLGETPESLNPALREYLQLVGRFWLLGMVWRVMEPGCKFDYCPVLEGVGGLRKSTLVEVLCGKEYFSDTPFDMSRGKEAQEQVQGIWLYEIAELSALSKGDVNAIKAFISSKVDKYRPAYGATVESYPRQCVLVGTTNDDQYLRDRTGNRRFWPVPVRHQINTEWVQKYRDQLLAEAFALYQQGVAYTPTADQEKRLFAPMQDSRLIETAVESRLMQLLTRDLGQAGDSGIHEDAQFVRIDQLVVALGSDVAKSSAALENQIRGWLKQQGWKHGKKQIAGARLPGYYRPDVWPPVAAVVGLDQIDRDSQAQEADAAAAPPQAPAGQAQAEPSVPLSPASQWVQDKADDDTPF